MEEDTSDIQPQGPITIPRECAFQQQCSDTAQTEVFDTTETAGGSIPGSISASARLGSIASIFGSAAPTSHSLQPLSSIASPLTSDLASPPPSSFGSQSGSTTPSLKSGLPGSASTVLESSLPILEGPYTAHSFF